MAPLTVSRSDPRIRAIINATFPDYRGRKVRLAPWSAPLHLDLSWSGGTRDRVALIDLHRGRIGHLTVPSPWSAGAADPVDAPAGSILVVHSIFCGRDAGLTIYLRPFALAALDGRSADLLSLATGGTR